MSMVKPHESTNLLPRKQKKLESTLFTAGLIDVSTRIIVKYPIYLIQWSVSVTTVACDLRLVLHLCYSYKYDPRNIEEHLMNNYVSSSSCLFKKMELFNIWKLAF
jgi:hypothetical protein